MQRSTQPLTRIFAFCCLFIALFAGSGCKKENKKNEVKFNNITATGVQEAPTPNNSTATARLDATYDKDTKILRYYITFSGLNPTMMHFHQGAVGTAGGVVIDLKPASGGITSPTSGSTRVLTSAEEAELLGGNWYLNLHSDTYPGGEVRGQLVAN